MTLVGIDQKASFDKDVGEISKAQSEHSTQQLQSCSENLLELQLKNDRARRWEQSLARDRLPEPLLQNLRSTSRSPALLQKATHSRRVSFSTRTSRS
jgi:hypothetical protein